METLLFHATWPRPSEVDLRDGNLCCEFKPARYYDLQNSYSSKSEQGLPNPPHVQFMNARGDAEMVEFVKAWGPLWMTVDEQRDARSVAHPLLRYQAERRWLTAVKELIHPVDEATSERERLAKFFKAEAELNKDSVALLSFSLPFAIDGSLVEWAATAGIEDIHAGINFAIKLSNLAPPPDVWIDWKNKKRTPRAGWQFLDLEQALRWMVWFDGYHEDPVHCCQECRAFYKPDRKHERKFCTVRCARRATSRAWERQKREKMRLAKEAKQQRKTKQGKRKTK